jgi:hypothetical protein
MIPLRKLKPQAPKPYWPAFWGSVGIGAIWGYIFILPYFPA